MLRGWRDYVSRRRRGHLGLRHDHLPGRPGRCPRRSTTAPVAIIGGVYAGGVDEGMKVMQPLRELGTVLFDMSRPTPFTAVQSGFDPLFPRNTLRAYWKSHYLDELTDEAIDVIAGRAHDRPAPLTLVNTFHMGGAIGDVGAGGRPRSPSARRRT